MHFRLSAPIFFDNACNTDRAVGAVCAEAPTLATASKVTTLHNLFAIPQSLPRLRKRVAFTTVGRDSRWAIAFELSPASMAQAPRSAFRDRQAPQSGRACWRRFLRRIKLRQNTGREEDMG